MSEILSHNKVGKDTMYVIMTHTNPRRVVALRGFPLCHNTHSIFPTNNIVHHINQNVKSTIFINKANNTLKKQNP